MNRTYDSSAELTVYLDLAYLPITFDCLTYLWGADIYRQKHGLTRQRVCILSDSYRALSERDLTYESGQKVWRRLNFIDRMPWLFPATSSVSILTSLPHNLATLSYPVNYNFSKMEFNWSALYSPGHLAPSPSKFDPFPLRAPNYARTLVSERFPLGSMVTLSVRHSKFQPGRNWPLDSVKDVAAYLKAAGLHPVIIPDFEAISDPSSELYSWDSERCGEIFWQASGDLFLRMAAYEIAAHNLVVGNGTSALLLYSPFPYSMFNIVVPGYHTTSEEFQRQFNGAGSGKKPDWSDLKNQHWVWESCDAENIIRHLKNIGL